MRGTRRARLRSDANRPHPGDGNGGIPLARRGRRRSDWWWRLRCRRRLGNSARRARQRWLRGACDQRRLARDVGRCFGQCRVKQRLHLGVALARRVATEDGGDNVLAVAAHGGHEVEARGARVAGLDAVGAAIARQQRIVVAIVFSAVGETAGRKQPVVAREVVLQPQPESDHIARRRDLLGVGQARGIAERGVRHADLARLARHQVGEVRFRAADMLGERDGDVVGRFGDESLDGVKDGQLLAGLEVQLGGGRGGALLCHLDLGIVVEPSELDQLEGQ